jgi:hypothetical protein
LEFFSRQNDRECGKVPHRFPVLFPTPAIASSSPQIRTSQLQRRRGTIGVDVRRSSQNNAVQGPEKPDIVREASALIDAAYLPLAGSHAVVDVVLVDAPAKAVGRIVRGISHLPFSRVSTRSVALRSVAYPTDGSSNFRDGGLGGRSSGVFALPLLSL